MVLLSPYLQYQAAAQQEAAAAAGRLLAERAAAEAAQVREWALAAEITLAACTVGCAVPLRFQNGAQRMLCRSTRRVIA